MICIRLTMVAQDPPEGLAVTDDASFVFVGWLELMYVLSSITRRDLTHEMQDGQT